MKKSLVLAALAALVVGSVVRFELVAQEVPGGATNGIEEQGSEGPDASADDAAPDRIDRRRVIVGENFFVAAVTTTLQKRLLGKHMDKEAVAYANINANSFIVPGTGLIDSQRLAVSDVRDALVHIAENDEGDGQLRILINYGYLPPNDAHRDLVRFLNATFEGMGRTAGFTDVRASQSLSNDESYVWKPLKLVAHGEDAVEENVGTETVQVYPVRTSLSRYFTGGLDCYMRLESPPVDKWDADYQETIRQALEPLELEQRKKVKVHLVLPKKKDPVELTEDEIFARKQREILAIQNGLEFEKDAVALLKGIGFEEIAMNIQSGPNNVTKTFR